MFRIQLLAAILLLPAAALAQQTGPGAAPVTTFQLSSRLVNVDVAVRDAHGNILRGLTQEDFKVLEDGKPQTIQFFTAHRLEPAIVGAETETGGEAARNEFSNVTHAGAAEPITIVLCDLLNTPNDDQLTARQQMLKFLDALPPGERIVLFALSNGLQMTQGLSGSPALRSAADKMLRPRDVGLNASKTESMMDRQIAANAAAQFGRSPAAATAMENAEPVSDSHNYEVRARSTISALGELARAVTGYPGRKCLYWLAESFPLSIDVAGPSTNSSLTGSATQFDTRLTAMQGHFSQTSRQEMRTTLNLLASARIAVYPTSVFGLPTQSSSAAVGSAVEFAANPGDPRGGFFTLANLRSEMEDLAQQTGGEAIFGKNDLAAAMQRTHDDAATYYTLAYKPSNADWNGRFRKIQVEAAGSGSLIYRRGYFATPDGSAIASAPDLDHVLQPGFPEETGLRLHSRVLPADPQHPGLMVETTIEAADVAFSTTSDGHHSAKLRVQMIGFNDSQQQPKSLPQTSGTLNLDLDPPHYRFVLTAGVAFRQQLPLKPGKYRVLLGVSDENSHKLGTLEMPISVPSL
jgi:VWFA-related protein